MKIKYNLHENVKTSICKDRNDSKTFADVKAAMQALSHSKDLFTNVISFLAMILHLGNLKYTAITVGE